MSSTPTAQSILSSRHARTGSRIDTLLLRMPRCILSEFNTHRMFSRNAASSRAIPTARMIQQVVDDPFIPLSWGRNTKGMQAKEECNAGVSVIYPRRIDVEENDYPGWLGITDKMVNADPAVMVENENRTREEAWLTARDFAVRTAQAFSDSGYHKQIVNRLLEPWMWTTVVATSTNWSNFLALRDHPDAEPHIQMLAREVRKALDGAEVHTLQPGEWHLPFTGLVAVGGPGNEDLIKLSVARCASTSYNTVEGFDMTPERAIELHDKLVSSVPRHASPCEHQAKAAYYPSDLGGNLGTYWVQYRKTIAGECQ